MLKHSLCLVFYLCTHLDRKRMHLMEKFYLNRIGFEDEIKRRLSCPQVFQLKEEEKEEVELVFPMQRKRKTSISDPSFNKEKSLPTNDMIEFKKFTSECYSTRPNTYTTSKQSSYKKYTDMKIKLQKSHDYDESFSMMIHSYEPKKLKIKEKEKEKEIY